MNTEQPTFSDRYNRPKKPVLGIISVALPLTGILVSLMSNLPSAFNFEEYARVIVPWTGYVLATMAFFRQERAGWAIVGAVLTSLYFGLHFIAIP